MIVMLTSFVFFSKLIQHTNIADRGQGRPEVHKNLSIKSSNPGNQHLMNNGRYSQP